MDKQFDELLAKYLNGSIQADEKKLLAALFDNPESQLALVTKVDAQFIDPTLSDEIDEETGKEIFSRIKQKIEENRPLPATDETELIVVRHLKPWYKTSFFRVTAVAASVITLLSLFFLLNNPSTHKNIAQQHNVDSTTQTIAHHVTNTGDKDKSVVLPDSSLIVLAAHSEITYQYPFITKRDIQLSGKAFFKVAKDKTKPFTVFSGAVTTTALGTQFLITAYEKTSQLTVELYEGKVVIKSVEQNNWRMPKDFYLHPGQKFIYSSDALAKVQSTKQNSIARQPQDIDKEVGHDKPLLPADYDGNWYMFNNQSLGQVLDNLAAMYNQPILYNKHDVQKIYFTGKYNKTDSLGTILQRIALLNDLKVQKSGNTYTISK